MNNTILVHLYKNYLTTLSDEPLDSDLDAYESPRDRAERVLEHFAKWLLEEDGDG